MADTLVLDTNAFSERGFSYYLRGYGGRKVLPAVAAAELYRHRAFRSGLDGTQFMERLRHMGVTVEPLDVRRALRAVDAMPSESELADALIGGHAMEHGRVLVTNDLDHFPQVLRKATPQAIMAG